MSPHLVLLNFEMLGHFKTSSLDVAAQSPDSTELDWEHGSSLSTWLSRFTVAGIK